MNIRIGFAFVLATLAVVCSSHQSQAQEFWAKFKTDYHRNACWPQPFRAYDAAAVQAPFEIMKNNGWRANNTLVDELFDPSTQRLTIAGRERILWIVTQAPASRRDIFVLQGADQQQTSARVEAVQLAVSNLLPSGHLPAITVTDIKPYNSSGAYQTTVNRAMFGSVPVPRLPTYTSLNAPSQVQTAPQAQGN